MKQFLSCLFFPFIANTIFVESINIIFNKKLSGSGVLVIALVGSVIGIGLARLLKIAMRLARNHVV